jgi:hypothetical protein
MTDLLERYRKAANDIFQTHCRILSSARPEDVARYLHTSKAKDAARGAPGQAAKEKTVEEVDDEDALERFLGERKQRKPTEQCESAMLTASPSELTLAAQWSPRRSGRTRSPRSSTASSRSGSVAQTPSRPCAHQNSRATLKVPTKIFVRQGNYKDPSSQRMVRTEERLDDPELVAACEADKKDGRMRVQSILNERKKHGASAARPARALPRGPSAHMRSCTHGRERAHEAGDGEHQAHGDVALQARAPRGSRRQQEGAHVRQLWPGMRPPDAPPDVALRARESARTQPQEQDMSILQLRGHRG